MIALLGGIALAAIASSLFSAGVAVQAMEARSVPAEHALRLSLIGRLIRKKRWLAGTAVTILGWPFQVVALLLAPVVVVQPALAFGLFVLLFLGKRYLHEPIGRRDVLAMGAIAAGVAGVAVVAPSASHTYAGGLTLALCLGGIALAAAAPYLLRLVGRDVPAVTMVSAGMGFAGGGVLSALVSAAVHADRWVLVLVWAAGSAAIDGLAVLTEMSALQRRPAIQVAPVGLVVQTVVPVALAPLLFNERPASLAAGLGLVAAMIVLVAGAVVLERSPALLAFVAGDGASVESGTAASPASDTREMTSSSARIDADDESTVTTTIDPARSGP